MSVEIKVGKRDFALVDDCWHWLDCQNWQVSGSGNTKYARTEIRLNNKRHQIQMHRIIMGAGKGEQVDHINGDGLDNRIENLRMCTYSENYQNSRKRKNCSSKYKGVHFYKDSQNWRAMITIPNTGHPIHIGLFKEEIEAAKAYDAKASELFGEFARLNFPEIVNETVDEWCIS